METNKRNQLLLDVITSDINNYVDWTYISRSPESNLSEDFMREFKYNIDWSYALIHQKMSENFIREHKDFVNWCSISKYQKLSEDFIREFADKVDWNMIFEYQNISENFINEFK